MNCISLADEVCSVLSATPVHDGGVGCLPLWTTAGL